jgi:L-cystine uptake protein TcyP (sodium:dicarboxylate symporter family)
MGIITLIFYPLFMMMEKWIDRFSRRFVKAGKSVGGKYIGLLVMFVMAILILTGIYAKVWYNINVLKLIANGTIGNVI